jgi:hypothetical protein
MENAIRDFDIKLIQQKIEPIKNKIILFQSEGGSFSNSSSFDELISQAARSDIGAVGAKVVDRCGRVIHSGFVLGMENAIAAEPFEGASRYKLDYTLDKMVVGSVSAIDLSY